MDNTSLIKMQKKVSSKIEFAKRVVQICACFNDIKLSETEITVLAYFMVYGVNQQSKNLIVSSTVCKNLANIKTIMVKLKKLNFIYKDDLNGKVYVAKVLNVELNSSVGIYLKISNEA